MVWDDLVCFGSCRLIDRMESAYGLVSNSGSYETSKKQKDRELEEHCAGSR